MRACIGGTVILMEQVFKNETWSKWVAQYGASCQYQSKYDMWQCTSSGKVNRVSTNVDLNFWMSDEPVITQDGDLGLRYQVCIQDDGWQSPVETGQLAGTEGKASIFKL